MRMLRLVVPILGASLLLAACSSRAARSRPAPHGRPDDGTPSERPPPRLRPPPPRPPGGPAINLGETTLGSVLVDGAGMTLYIFTADSARHLRLHRRLPRELAGARGRRGTHARGGPRRRGLRDDHPPRRRVRPGHVQRHAAVLLRGRHRPRRREGPGARREVVRHRRGRHADQVARPRIARRSTTGRRAASVDCGHAPCPCPPTRCRPGAPVAARRRARPGGRVLGRPRDGAAARRGRGPRSAASVLHGTPVTTLDDHLARGLRVAALAELVDGFVPRAAPDDDPAILRDDQVRFGPPILRPAVVPRLLRVRAARPDDVGPRRAGSSPRPGTACPIFYFSNVSELRGDGDPVWAPAGSVELDYEAEIGALIDAPRDEPARGTGRGGDRRLPRAQRLVGARPPARRGGGPAWAFAKGKDFALSIGPWLVTPDELADRRRAGCHRARPRRSPRRSGRPMRAACASSRPRVARGRRSTTRWARWSREPPRTCTCGPGELLGTGTVGGGCLLEVREETLGRWLEPGDEVTLEVERLGRLVTPIVARPSPIVTHSDRIPGHAVRHG